VGAGIKVATAARPAINRVFSPRDSLDLGFLPGWERGRRRHRAQSTSRDCARSHRARPGLSWFASLNLSRSLLRLCSATLETIIVTRPPTARTAPTESAATKRGGGQDSPEHQIEFTPAPPTIARPTPAAAVETFSLAAHEAPPRLLHVERGRRPLRRSARGTAGLIRRRPRPQGTTRGERPPSSRLSSQGPGERKAPPRGGEAFVAYPALG